jgi:hypothetical protein
MAMAMPPAWLLHLIVGYYGSVPSEPGNRRRGQLIQGRTIEVASVARLPSIALLSPGAVAEPEQMLARTQNEYSVLD